MRKPLLHNRTRVKNPTGIKDAEPHELKDIWWLVMPENARDVIFLQLLGSHQRFANYDGEGILVSDSAMPAIP